MLRYICCRDGQRATRRNGDGLMGAPHTHYRRSVFEQCLLHKRNRKQYLGCADIRVRILNRVKKYVTEEWINENISDNAHHLQHQETCQCEF